MKLRQGGSNNRLSPGSASQGVQNGCSSPQFLETFQISNARNLLQPVCACQPLKTDRSGISGRHPAAVALTIRPPTLSAQRHVVVQQNGASSTRSGVDLTLFGADRNPSTLPRRRQRWRPTDIPVGKQMSGIGSVNWVNSRLSNPAIDKSSSCHTLQVRRAACRTAKSHEVVAGKDSLSGAKHSKEPKGRLVATLRSNRLHPTRASFSGRAHFQ